MMCWRRLSILPFLFFVGLYISWFVGISQAVLEYCDAGNLVDLIPVAVMKESEIIYVIKEVSLLHVLLSTI